MLADLEFTEMCFLNAGTSGVSTMPNPAYKFLICIHIEYISKNLLLLLVPFNFMRSNVFSWYLTLSRGRYKNITGFFFSVNLFLDLKNEIGFSKFLHITNKETL